MKLNIKKQLPEVGGLVLGGAASGYVEKFIPIANPKVKTGGTIVLGLILSSQKGMLGNIGRGLIAGAGRNLPASFGIGGPFILGADDMPTFVTGTENFITEDTVGGIEDGRM